MRQSIKALTEANGLLDTWIGHFDLGRAYLEAASSRRPILNSTAVSNARAKRCRSSSTKSPRTHSCRPSTTTRAASAKLSASRDSPTRIGTYLGIRGKAGEDPLLPEVRRPAARSPNPSARALFLADHAESSHRFGKPLTGYPAAHDDVCPCRLSLLSTASRSPTSSPTGMSKSVQSSRRGQRGVYVCGVPVRPNWIVTDG